MDVLRRLFCILCLILLGTVASGGTLDAQPDEGPLGLRWGIPKEAVEAMEIRLCCRQVGKYGARYTVDRRGFANFPKPLGDEETIYLYFGNTNKLQRIYIAIKKVDGWNRFKQVNLLAKRKYTLAESCQRKTVSKYQALQRQTQTEPCKQYEAYSLYKQDGVEVFVGLEKQGAIYRVSIIALHTTLFQADATKRNPL